MIAEAETNEEGSPSGERTFRGAAREQLNTPLIVVPSDWEPQPGAELNDQLVIGEMLGEGMAGAVYSVDKKDSSNTKRVLKVLKANADEESRETLERELVIGRLLTEEMCVDDPEGYPTVPGYMMTQAAVRKESKDGPLIGIIVEKIRGTDVFDRLDAFGTDKPVNVQYVREALSQTLRALQAGQESLGFYHRDLHAGNVMEHWHTDSLPKVEIQVQEHGVMKQKTLKQEDLELSSHGWRYRSNAESDEWRDLHTEELKIEFKIIDYGWAVVTSLDDEELSELVTSGGEEGLPGPIGFGNTMSSFGKFLLGIVWPVNCQPVAQQASGLHGAILPDETPKRAGKTADSDFVKLDPKTKEKLKKSSIPKAGFNSKMYHHIWKGSSDCWRLLASMAATLDGKLWASTDVEQVLALEDLLFRASGVHMRLEFTNLEDSEKYRRPPPAWPIEKAKQLIGQGKRGLDMGWAMAFPSDPGYSIEEALDHPFLRAS